MYLWHRHKPDHEAEETWKPSSLHCDDYYSSYNLATSGVGINKFAYEVQSQFAAKQGVGLIEIAVFLIWKLKFSRIQTEKFKKNSYLFLNFNFHLPA